MINIKVLIDNNSLNDCYSSEHGLSMVITTSSTSVMLDFGKTNNMFTNADKLGLDLNKINLAVISHAHYDHTGGLANFIQVNPKCRIYARDGINGKYYSKKPVKGIVRLLCAGKDYKLHKIGLNKNNKSCINKLNIISQDTKISEGVHILCDQSDNFIVNKNLLTKRNGAFETDNFSHECILIIEEKSCIHVFTGCCHRGVMSTLNYTANKFNKPIASLVGGLHLVGKDRNGINSETAKKAVEAIKKHNVRNIVVGHCTTDEGFKYLKKAFPQTKQFCAGYEFNL